MVFDSFFDLVFGHVLALPTFWAVLVMSLLISLIITVIYKYTTNQNLMKEMKDEIKELQKEAKELKDNPSEMMKANKKMMETNMKYMTHSLKPTLITFVPIILIFGWMSSNFAYEPIKPKQEFTVDAVFTEEATGKIKIYTSNEIDVQGDAEKDIKDGKASWLLSGGKGEHLLEFGIDGEKQSINVIIDDSKYSEPLKKIKNSKIKEIVIGNRKKTVMDLFGWKLGWLGTYIIFSIVFSMGLRKLMKLH